MAVLLLAAAGCGGQRPVARVERWSALGEATVTVAGARVSPPPELRWDGAAVAESWAHEGVDGAAVLRSPRLDLASGAELGDVLVTAVATRPGVELSVMWSDEVVPALASMVGTRRTFRAVGAGRREDFRLTGVQLSELRFAAAELPIRSLVLTHPAGEVTVEDVVVRRREALDAGFEPMVVAGEVRRARVVLGDEQWSAAAVLGRSSRLETALAAPAGSSCLVSFDSGVDGGAEAAAQRIEIGPSFTAVVAELPGAGRRRVGLHVTCTVYPVIVAEPLLLHPGRPALPSVILYVEDALRATEVGHLGGPPGLTPVLDRLAAAGVAFGRCQANASWTKPSVVTLLTSLPPHTHRVGARSHGDVVPPGVATLPGLLAAHGFLTASFSANPLASTLSDLHLGFDLALTPDAFPPDPTTGKVPSEAVTDRLLPWLESHRRLPLFVYVHTMDPHTPLIERPLPAGVAGYGAGDRRDLYRGEVHHNDAQLGRLVRVLEADPGETLLVVTADHGESFAERGPSGHGNNVYQEEIHVPLVLWWPGVKVARTVVDPVELADVAPTLLGVAGVAVPAAMRGRDLLAAGWAAGDLVSARYTYPDDRVLWPDGYEEHTSLTRGRWKLMVVDAGRGGAPTVRLFDLERDPGERDDLSGAHPDLVRELRAALAARLEGDRSAGDRLEAAPSAVALSPADRQRLEGLGYLGGDDG